MVRYLADQGGIFESTLRRCGVELLIRGPAKPEKGEHAARQFARPLQELGLAVEDLAAKVYPSIEDRHHAQEFLRDLPRQLVVFHPGSGSKKKTWPVENWIDIGNGLLGLDDFQGSLIIVSGEADDDQVRSLRAIWKNERVQFAKHFPLAELAAVFEHAVFIGHDSGISHLAAAASADCILLFGPSDPEAWAPLNENVQVIRGADGKIDNIKIPAVEEPIQPLLRPSPPARQVRELQTY